ncbi:MAG: hypothetical protein AB7F98_04730 [Novosphingobium sp.]
MTNDMPVLHGFGARLEVSARLTMAISLLFLFGIANFALHKAVLESDHPLLGQMPRFLHLFGGRGSLLVEFLMLLGAMTLVAQGSQFWVWGYAGYSAINGLAAWMILSDRL